MPIETSSIFNFLLQIFPYLFGSGGLILWFLERRKNKASADKEESTANQEMAKAYREMVIDNDNLRKELKAELQAQKEEMAKLKMSLEAYKKQCSVCENNKIK